MTLLNLNCHFQDPVFKYIYIPEGSGAPWDLTIWIWSGDKSQIIPEMGIQRGIGEGGAAPAPCGPGHCSMLAIFICDDCVTQIMVISLPKFPWNTSY